MAVSHIYAHSLSLARPMVRWAEIVSTLWTTPGMQPCACYKMSSESSVISLVKPGVAKFIVFHSQVLMRLLFGIIRTQRSLPHRTTRQPELKTGIPRKSEAIHITMCDIHSPCQLPLQNLQPSCHLSKSQWSGGGEMVQRVRALPVQARGSEFGSSETL